MWRPRLSRRKAALLYALCYLLLLLIPGAAYLLTREAPGEEAAAPLPSPAAGGTPPAFLESRQPSQEPGGNFTLYDQSAGELLTLSPAEFLPGALACEMDPSAPREALKAQAVAAYTLYGPKRGSGEAPKGGEFSCDTAAWQVYTTREEMAQRWGDAFEETYALLQEIAAEVEGQSLTYQGAPALTPYFSISAGATVGPGNVWAQESAGAYPYLAGTASPWDAFADGYLGSATLTAEEFRQAATAAFPGLGLDFSGPEEEWLTGLETTPGGYVAKALLGGREVTGSQLRSAFGLRSAAFSIRWENGSCTFTTRGWGHGVGMSQAGAAYLASQGMGYREILAYYYPGTELVGE